MDRLYVTYLRDHAWTAPRATRNLPADAPDWAVLASRLWYRGLVSEGAIEQSENSAVEIGAVRQAIVDELARRRRP